MRQLNVWSGLICSALLISGCGGGGSAPAPIVVPNVVGQTQAAATTIMTSANLTVGTVTTQSSSTVAIGSVISQSPSADTLVSGGSPVSLAISTGVAMPNVVGQTQAAATTAITGAGLTVGTTTRAVSTTVPVGSVISENPSAGSIVSPGTSVSLVISSPFTPLTALMTVPRVNHAATLLSNSRVLITGGLTGVAASVLNLAEVFDSSTQAFTRLTATMVTARYWHTATLLPNGQVLITGGNGVNSAFNTAELYDPVANTFTALTATMTTNRAGHSATLLPNGKVLITGGADSYAVALFNTAEIYDPVAQTFTALTVTMTTPRAGHSATLLPNGTVIISGGAGPGGNDLTSAELYDPVANTFTALTATLTTGRTEHAAAPLSGGEVLVTGGEGNGNLLDSTEEYDPVAQRFTALAATMTTPRVGHTATTLSDGQVLLTGGYVDSSRGAAETAELYTPP
jgi:N-acetylneuraminic acid mutarotase